VTCATINTPFAKGAYGGAVLRDVDQQPSSHHGSDRRRSVGRRFQKLDVGPALMRKQRRQTQGRSERRWLRDAADVERGAVTGVWAF
jgi:hypothetical protein